MKSNNSKKQQGFFITGTDTGVGKTHVTLTILQQLSAQSISCVAMKPIASGANQTEDGLRNDDALKLQQASSVDVAYELLNPYCFEPAIAPHLAAQQSGVNIQSSVIMEAYQELSCLADVVLVEGIGGWQVPLNLQKKSELSIALLAEQLQLPVILVVALRLGCLNHALLTHHSIYSSQCRFAGWVANAAEPAFEFADANLLTLEQQLSVPLLANISFSDISASTKNTAKIINIIDLDHWND